MHALTWQLRPSRAALVGGSAVYCVMRAVPAKAAAPAAGAPAANDDLKQRLNRLKAAQAAAA